MNLYQLKAFYYTGKFGSVSRAAKELYITQPAATKHIQKLQKFYNIRFLNKVGKRMILTDAGRALAGIAEKIFEMESQAEEIIRDFQQLKSGHIYILASESFGAYYLPHIIISFNKKFPKIHISASILPVEEVIENIITFKCDLGFVSYIRQDPKLVVREILKENIILIVPVNHHFAHKTSINPGELDGQSMIMHETGSATRVIVDNFLVEHNISVNIACEFSNNETIKRAVENGVGLSLVSMNVAREEVKRGSLKAVPVKDQSLLRKFYMIHHKEKYFSKPLKYLINLTDAWTSEYKKLI